MMKEPVFDKYYLSTVTDEWTILLDEYRDYAIKKCDEEIENLVDGAESSEKKEVLEKCKYMLLNAMYHDLHEDYHMKVTANLSACKKEDAESTFDYKAHLRLVLGDE